jgi:hypothetical protein
MRLAHAICLIIALFCAADAARGADAKACAPPPDFADTPHPAMVATEKLVSHTEEILIARSIAMTSEAMNKPLNRAIHQSSSLPGVSGDFVLTKGPFGSPGSRRVVCLSDGGVVEEEVLERENTATSSRFRYIVWNYHTPKAKPIAYGIGEFRSLQIDPSHTCVTWVYSFRLKDDVFPGNLGALGRSLFRVYFLDRDYAAMMRGVLSGYKRDAENQPAGGEKSIVQHGAQ